MKHEKLITRDDGKKIKLIVTLQTDFYKTTADYAVDVRYCPPRKRKWKSAHSTDDYEWRRLKTAQEKNAYEENKALEHVSPAEILEAKIELWEMLRPPGVAIVDPKVRRAIGTNIVKGRFYGSADILIKKPDGKEGEQC
jgi:hypothetical protein